MKWMGTSKINWLGSLWVIGSLICSGCAVTVDDVVNGVGDKIDHDSGVNYYQEHGMNRKEAERNAYEDQVWDKMDK